MKEAFTWTEKKVAEVSAKSLGRYKCRNLSVKITTNYLMYLRTLASRWLEVGCAGPDWCSGLDLNQDALVNLVDLALFDACCIEVIR
ncbi:MAG: hypothetical protein ACYTEX_24375 [Planctomycetota bacterium]|jgi:hypothetical protein